MPIAEANLENITNYLLENWGIKACEKFLARFDDVCKAMSANIALFSIINKKKKIRKCVLTHQNIIYFREGQQNIEILAIFDTRQDPEKLIAIIKNL